MNTPALVINNKVVLSGRLPAKKELTELIAANNKDDIKEMVKQRYNDAVSSKAVKSCCGSDACCGSDNKIYSIMNEDYSRLNGYMPDADLGFGCGLPTKYAGIKPGNTVVDLGSGAGNDCFVALAETAESGHVIGIDFAPEMIAKAKKNAEKLGAKNIEFRQGDIENMPVDSNSADVVISNCVLNLLPKKDKIFHEISRVLKTGGHFCVSDIVLEGKLPSVLKNAAEMYAGCVAGAIQKNDYINKILKAGFKDVKVVKEHKITIPDEILLNYLDSKSLEKFKNGDSAVLSVTVTGVK
ncbi:MAG: arsenite methyltransferase [Endomicrobia bacterium]|nr:arsenite methyltransferase [Endomicrobiia bacterium]MCL2506156.1 arsenite methyltransferase [Endomicrobiia bacterium]